MLFLRKDPTRETLIQPDDTIFKPDPSSMMKLPGETAEAYEELQVFNQVWIWVLMGVETAGVLLPMVIVKVALPILALAALVMLLTLVLMASLKMKTRIDDEGVHYRLSGFQWKDRVIPWTEIDQVYVRKYSPMMEYGGWGIRKGKSGWAYTMRGNYGIHIVKKDGKQILVGTQHPEAVKDFLSKHPLLV